MCASAASMLFLCTDVNNRYAMDYSMMMIHRAQGGSEDARKKYDQAIEMILMKEFPDKNELSKMLDKETYLDCNDMINKGLMYATNMIKSKQDLQLSPVNQTLDELVNIYNKIDLNDMEETVKTDETKTEETVIETVSEDQEVEKVENTDKQPELDDNKELENKIEALTVELTAKNTEVETLTNEVETLKSELSKYKEDEVKAEKLEVLENSNVSKESYDKWLDLDLDTIKNLVSTIVVKSPLNKEKTQITNKTFDAMTPEERVELAKTDQEAYLELLRESKK